jgi:hypothetical protein
MLINLFVAINIHLFIYLFIYLDYGGATSGEPMDLIRVAL